MQTFSDQTPLLKCLLPDTASFHPKEGLHIANHSVADLAQKYGTPLYLYDRATIINACKRYAQAFHQSYTASPTRIVYASKAYLSPLIAQLITEQGMGLDTVSGGELRVAERVNFPMEHVSFHGNNKSEEELRLALKLGVGRIVLDNWDELRLLTRIASEMHLHPGVLLRVAPGIDTETHRYLQTGHSASKFGFPLENGQAKEALQHILGEGRLHLLGLHAHIGTMLRDTRPYQETLRCLLTLAEELYDELGWWPEEISPGGGWAIESPENPTTPGVEALAQAIQTTMAQYFAALNKLLPCPTLIFEPGRSIVARAGIAVYRVGARKSTPGGVTYIFVDGGMADNIRPALYGAQYTALAFEQALAPAEETVCISGRYCESGDILINSVPLPRMQRGDYLAIPAAGAYCLSMASNYNLVPRPAVLLLDQQQVQIMERRETFDDILVRYPAV